MNVNAKYKNSVFSLLFSNPEALIENEELGMRNEE